MEHSEGSPDQEANGHYSLLTVTIKDSKTLQVLYEDVWQRRWKPNIGWDKGIRIAAWRINPPPKEGDPK